jgi:hypothetical protein
MYHVEQETGPRLLVPSALRPEYDRILTALHGVHHCEDLPWEIIHNDCLSGNAVRTVNG